MRYLFDSNPLIYFLNELLPSYGDHLILTGMRDGAAYSVITRVEVLGFPAPTEQMDAARRLLDDFTEIGLTEPINH